MKLVHSLPLLLIPLSVLVLAPSEGSTPGQVTTQEREAARQEEERLRGKPDADKLPPGVGNGNVGALDIFGRPLRARENTLVQRIQGGWQLTSMELLGSSKAGRSAVGFLNVGPNYLSIEVHASWTGDNKSIEYDFHTVFTAEYTLDATGKLQTRSVIGSYIEEQTGLLKWEAYAFPREYYVSETSKELVLTFDKDKSRLTFKPRPPMMLGRSDIFGRRQVVDPMDNSIGTDIFGRDSTDTEGVRDIFGRIVPENVPGEKAAEKDAQNADDKKSIDPRETPPGGGGGR